MRLLFELHELSFVNLCPLKQLDPTLQSLERLKAAGLGDQIICIRVVLEHLLDLDLGILGSFVDLIDIKSDLFSQLI